MTTLSEPLLFDAYLRPQIWGGDRLVRLLGNPPHPQHALAATSDAAKPPPYGEAWVLSTLPEHVSRVAVGPARGESLAQLWQHSRLEMTGDRPPETDYPWLIKWLDCHDDLSLQVHPDDAAARTFLGQSHGKSEAWIVTHVAPGARISTGLLDGVTRANFEQHLAAGTMESCLHTFEPHVGDCLSLPAGTVHTARGVVLAEIQQPSDATFRLFDWNRLDPTGHPRPLHRDWGLTVIDWQQGPIRPVVPSPIPSDHAGVAGERLLETNWVRLERFTLKQSMPGHRSGELTAWMVLDGGTTLFVQASGSRYELPRGSTVLIPAAVGPVEWSPATSDHSAPYCSLLCISQPRV